MNPRFKLSVAGQDAAGMPVLKVVASGRKAREVQAIARAWAAERGVHFLLTEKGQGKVARMPLRDPS